MNVGELFVSLGVKGSDKTISAIANVQTGLGQVASMSLEAKAAIVGAFYALEQLTAASTRMATGMINLSALTGQDQKTLQQWAHAAELAGINAQDAANTFTSLQNVMTNLRWNKSVPEGWQQFQQIVHGVDKSKFVNDFGYAMGKIRDLAKAPIDPGTRNMLLKNLGISESMIGPLVRGKFDPEVLNKMLFLTNQQNAALDKFRTGIVGVGQTWEKEFGVLTAEHGTEVIKNIKDLSNALLELTVALDKLGTKTHVFDVLSTIGKNVSSLILTIASLFDADVLKKHPELVPSGQFQSPGSYNFQFPTPGNSTTNINTTIHAHGVKDASEIGKHVEQGIKKHINKSQRTSPQRQEK